MSGVGYRTLLAICIGDVFFMQWTILFARPTSSLSVVHFDCIRLIVDLNFCFALGRCSIQQKLKIKFVEPCVWGSIFSNIDVAWVSYEGNER